MKTLLLTTCVLALLSTLSFAQEKSPEQLREERGRIFGIEGMETETFSRNVASGTKQRIGFYASVNPDCSAVGDVAVRVTKQPEHGAIEMSTITDYVHFSKENVRSKCNQHKVKGTAVFYKAEKYTGSDELDLLVLFPHGGAWEHHFNINVR
jgi:hypothetical protein